MAALSTTLFCRRDKHQPPRHSETETASPGKKINSKNNAQNKGAAKKKKEQTWDIVESQSQSSFVVGQSL